MDECSEREQLLKLLTSLHEIIQMTSVHGNVWVTSREEHNISKGLTGVISETVSLECGGLDSDIEHYIRKCRTQMSGATWETSMP